MNKALEKQIEEIIIEHAQEVHKNKSLYCGKKCPKRILDLITARDKRLIERINNMEKPIHEVGCSGTHDEGQEYNDAIDDAIQLIREGEE